MRHREGCPKQPSYGVAGGGTRGFCSAQALFGRIDFFYNNCNCKGGHDITGINTSIKKCDNEDCSKMPNYGVEGIRKCDLCAEHTVVEMAGVVHNK